MRLVILYFLFAFIVSCKPNVDKSSLLGSWTTEHDRTKYPDQKISDKITFYANGSLTIEYYQDGKVQESHSGRYSLDVQKKILTTEYDTLKFRFEVLTFTKKSLTARQIGAGNMLVLRKL